MKTRTLVFSAAAAVFAGLLALGGSVNAQQAPPVEFGDLIKLYRNTAGIPELTPNDVAGPNTGLCQQPLYFASDACPTTCAIDSIPIGVVVVDVDQSTCAVVVRNNFV